MQRREGSRGGAEEGGEEGGEEQRREGRSSRGGACSPGFPDGREAVIGWQRGEGRGHSEAKCSSGGGGLTVTG